MTAYPYRYRPRRKASGKETLIAAAVLAALVAASGTKAATSTAARHGSAGGSPAAAQAIAYVRDQLGKPYLWGGTGPSSFDCSGLVMEAYASAGVHLARTSQQQWATEPHVSSPQPGDLVFFAGSDGTMTAPGHVGIVIGHGQMIEAYGSGYPIRVVGYARPDLVGFSQPWGA